MRRNSLALVASVAAFLLVASIGAATSFYRGPAGDSGTDVKAEADSSILSGLEDYAATLDSEGAASPAAANNLLPDVNTMIERLAARLEADARDANGWRMLGWSYYNTERYGEAVAAYEKALEIDPGSAELKRAHEEAKAKASGDVTAVKGGAPQEEAHGNVGGSVPEHGAAAKAATPHDDTNTAIRAMVDGLAHRLESSPRDVDGWTRLMRSRVVLGEKDVAEAALRKALDVFKDDADASGQIMAAATQLGLKVE